MCWLKKNKNVCCNSSNVFRFFEQNFPPKFDPESCILNLRMCFCRTAVAVNTLARAACFRICWARQAEVPAPRPPGTSRRARRYVVPLYGFTPRVAVLTRIPLKKHIICVHTEFDRLFVFLMDVSKPPRGLRNPDWSMKVSKVCRLLYMLICP